MKIGAIVIILASIAFLTIFKLNIHVFDNSDHLPSIVRFQINETILVALREYRKDMGEFPSNDHGLASLVTPPTSDPSKWKGPYLDTQPKDPWGRYINYERIETENGFTVHLVSFGPDGIQSSDDIRSQ